MSEMNIKTHASIRIINLANLKHLFLGIRKLKVAMIFIREVRFWYNEMSHHKSWLILMEWKSNNVTNWRISCSLINQKSRGFPSDWNFSSIHLPVIDKLLLQNFDLRLFFFRANDGTFDQSETREIGYFEYLKKNLKTNNLMNTKILKWQDCLKKRNPVLQTFESENLKTWKFINRPITTLRNHLIEKRKVSILNLFK